MSWFFESRIEKALALEVQWLRERLDKAQERNDRLVEALGRKNDITVSMPVVARERLPLERSEGYFDTKPIPAISTSGGTKK